VNENCAKNTDVQANDSIHTTLRIYDFFRIDRSDIVYGSGALHYITEQQPRLRFLTNPVAQLPNETTY
jgi:hypothetical protein